MKKKKDLWATTQVRISYLEEHLNYYENNNYDIIQIHPVGILPEDAEEDEMLIVAKKKTLRESKK